MNDTDDRITQFQEGGYELVQDETVKVGDSRVSSGTPVGTTKNCQLVEVLKHISCELA